MKGGKSNRYHQSSRERLQRPLTANTTPQHSPKAKIPAKTAAGGTSRRPSKATPSIETMASSNSAPASSLEIRNRYLVNSSEEDEEAPDEPQPDTSHLFRQILLIDEELRADCRQKGRPRRRRLWRHAMP